MAALQATGAVAVAVNRGGGSLLGLGKGERRRRGRKVAAVNGGAGWRWVAYDGDVNGGLVVWGLGRIRGRKKGRVWCRVIL